MDIVFLWLVMGVVVAIIASSKGKSAGVWFVYGALIWPIALVHILVTSKDNDFVEGQLLASGGKKCPECAEIIKCDAAICRFCRNREFPESSELPEQKLKFDRQGRIVSKPEHTLWENLWWKPDE